MSVSVGMIESFKVQNVDHVNTGNVLNVNLFVYATKQ